MNPSLQSLAAFLRIEEDLLHAAAQANAAFEDTMLRRGEMRAWIAALRVEERDDVLTRLIVDSEQVLVAGLLQQFLKDQSGGAIRAPGTRRAVGELLLAARAYTKERLRLEAEERANEETCRARQGGVTCKGSSAASPSSGQRLTR